MHHMRDRRMDQEIDQFLADARRPDGPQGAEGSSRVGYRGFQIEEAIATQLGYRLGEGTRSRPGKGRKSRSFAIYAPDDLDRPIKTKDSLAAAKSYIDDYIGQ